jgi:hypothetical protein
MSDSRIGRVKVELPQVIDMVQIRAGGDVRVGLTVCANDLDVLHALTTDIAAVKSTIGGLMADRHSGAGEASDEALRENRWRQPLRQRRAGHLRVGGLQCQRHP